VPYYIAYKLHDLGFDFPCFGYFESEEVIVTNEFIIDMSIKNIIVSFDNPKSVHYIGIAAPLWQQVEDWFLLKHKIDIKTNYMNCGAGKGWCWYIYTNISYNYQDIIDSLIDLKLPLYEDKYKARIPAILKAIEIIS